MKKIIASLTAVTFLGSSTLAVSACGVSDGAQVEIKINNPPKKIEDNQNPITDYVYNNKYGYNEAATNYLIALAAQLASDKIRADDQKTLTSATWDEFYRSEVWQSGNFSSFSYDLSGITLPTGEQDFSYKANNDQDLIYQVNNNDASDDNNKLRIYWFITSPTTWTPDNSNSYQPTKNNITIPEFAEFTNDSDSITRNGWIHLYLLIGAFRIDFSAEISFIFNKVVDKNGIPLVVLSSDTFAKPFGEIKFNNAEEVANKKIFNLSISKPASTKY